MLLHKGKDILVSGYGGLSSSFKSVATLSSKMLVRSCQITRCYNSDDRNILLNHSFPTNIA